MVWNPNLSSVPQPIPTYRLFVWKLYVKGVIRNPREVLKDTHGIYGYRYPQFILVAKKEVYGNVVSVHEEAMLKARMAHVNIIMWLDSAKKFYAFNPEEIDAKGERNFKGLTPMVNFNINLGKHVDW
jgi:hypothetical protein